MREARVKCLSAAGFHHMAYVEWGDAANPRVLVCVHGLTRSGRDFDFLAQAMAADYRVVCPDIVGRGRSDWLRNKALYAIPQYCADMTNLLAKLDVESVDWVGTSMGGLIGMALACQPETPIARLVLNDVGPVITAVSLARIGTYLGTAPRFDDIAPINTIPQARCPVLLVHGVDDDVVPFSDAQRLQNAGRAGTVECVAIRGGHDPTDSTADYQAQLMSFLQRSFLIP